MRSLIQSLIEMKTKLENEEGATMVEYALVVALIAIAAITAVTNLGTAISTKFTSIANLLP